MGMTGGTSFPFRFSTVSSCSSSAPSSPSFRIVLLIQLSGDFAEKWHSFWFLGFSACGGARSFGSLVPTVGLGHFKHGACGCPVGGSLRGAECSPPIELEEAMWEFVTV